MADSPIDLNAALSDALTIARGEYRYVADLVTDFGELPPVPCHGGDIGQAVINLTVSLGPAVAKEVA